MSSGKSVLLFLADGTPGGLLTAEIKNWTGHIVAAPRSALAELLKRQEASRTGVYILLGDNPQSVGGQMAYIGEGDDVSRRLYQHAKPEAQNGKDFWDRAVVLTNKDANFTKAHVRYLESRFISLAQHTGRAALANSTSPPQLLLPEADISDMEYYIAQAKIILPLLGVNIFRAAEPVAPSGQQETGLSVAKEPAVFELRFKKEGIVATAEEIDGEFTVRSGSQARLAWLGGTHSYRGLREKLEQDSTLVATPGGKSMIFSRDQVFSSPSAAAAIVLGRPANGRTDWVTPKTGETYGDWQQKSLEQSLGNVVA